MFSMLGNNLKLEMNTCIFEKSSNVSFYLNGIGTSSMKFWTFEGQFVNHCLAEFSIMLFASDIYSTVYIKVEAP